MKITIIIAFALLLPLSSLLAESITARPFSFELYTTQANMRVSAQLSLTCRYEKLVIGDTAQYHFRSKKIPLEIVKTELGNKTRHLIGLDSEQRLNLEGIFKPTKECSSNIEVLFVDTKYSVGWASQFDRPIEFSFNTRQSYSDGDTFVDLSKVYEEVDNKTIEFFYKPVPNLQVNIWLYADGEELASPTSAAIDPETGMPFRLTL